jgi:RNA polymerase sigma factor (sigma-70 family)
MHELNHKLTAKEWKELEVLVAEKNPAAIERAIIEAHGIGRAIAIKGEQRASRPCATIDADDAASEVAIRAIKHIPRWEPGKMSLRSWVWMLAIHTVKDAVARERIRRTASSENHLGYLAEPNSGDRAEQRETQAKVRSAIQSLPTRWQAAVRHYYGIETPELKSSRAVGERLGISHTSVNAILGSAKQRLAQYFATTRSSP